MVSKKKLSQIPGCHFFRWTTFNFGTGYNKEFTYTNSTMVIQQSQIIQGNRCWLSSFWPESLLLNFGYRVRYLYPKSYNHHDFFGRNFSTEILTFSPRCSALCFTGSIHWKRVRLNLPLVLGGFGVEIPLLNKTWKPLEFPKKRWNMGKSNVFGSGCSCCRCRCRCRCGCCCCCCFCCCSCYFPKKMPNMCAIDFKRIDCTRTTSNKIPIGSMQGLFTYIWIKCMENIDKYSTAIQRLGFASQKEWAGNLEAPRQGMTFAEHKNNSQVVVWNDCRLKNIYNIRDINECLNSRWFHVRSQSLLKPKHPCMVYSSTFIIHINQM